MWQKNKNKVFWNSSGHCPPHQCFSDIARDMMGTSGFMIFLCLSIIKAISVNAQSQVTNCLSSTLFRQQHLGILWSKIQTVVARRHLWTFARSSSFQSMVAEIPQIISELGGQQGLKGKLRGLLPFVIQTQPALVWVPNSDRPVFRVVLQMRASMVPK